MSSGGRSTMVSDPSSSRISPFPCLPHGDGPLGPPLCNSRRLDHAMTCLPVPYIELTILRQTVGSIVVFETQSSPHLQRRGTYDCFAPCEEGLPVGVDSALWAEPHRSEGVIISGVGIGWVLSELHTE